MIPCLAALYLLPVAGLALVWKIGSRDGFGPVFENPASRLAPAADLDMESIQSNDA